MTQPLVSILIPLYNAEKYVAATIESALAQTWPYKEIIVVDDGSKDEGLKVARQFESQGVRVDSQPNSGATAARNRAFALSKGQFIQYLDADDVLDADKIEVQLRYAQGREDAVVAGHWRRFAGNIENAIGGWGPDPSIDHDLLPVDWLIQIHMMQTGAWLTPRRLVEQAGPWNEALKQNPNDDGEFFMRVVAASSQVLFCPEARIHYRTEATGTLASLRTDDACRSLLETCHTFRRVVLGLEDSERTRQAVANYYMKFVYDMYPAHASLCRQAESIISELGGSNLTPPGTPSYLLLSRLIGWETASWLWKVVLKRG